MIYEIIKVILFLLQISKGLELPNDCNVQQYYDTASLSCRLCPTNSSMVKSDDGFSCTCEEHSVRVSYNRCKACNATELVSTDGSSCVPRKCQNMAGKLVCRKCPADFISVTQNLDGSPMKEVACIKCARGFKVENNKCVRCISCSCDKSQVVVRGSCLPKNYVTNRPKYEEKILHPQELLDIVKYEYFCTQNDLKFCHLLTSQCVKNFYSNDLGGACRLWLYDKHNIYKSLPSLTLPITNDKKLNVIGLSNKKKYITITVAVFTSDGKMSMLDIHTKKRHNIFNDCMLPITIDIGIESVCESKINISDLQSSEMNETLSPYLYTDGQYKPLPVIIRKPTGYVVMKGVWPSDLFKRYFIIHNTMSTISNITNTIYLRTLLIRVQTERDKKSNGSLRVQASIEAQYAIKPAYEQTIVTSLVVEHIMPSAGIVRGLEVCGGILGALLLLYALVRCRGTVRRGASPLSVVPLFAGCIADTLYFSVLLATVHSWTAEAGTLGMILPLSHLEERMIRSFIYSAISLKAVKIGWIVWKQCTCDVFFLDWSKYNPPVKETNFIEDDKWKVTMLAREWSLMQTMRRTNPGYTVILTLLVVHLMSQFKSIIPTNQGYQWVFYSIVWWSTYTLVLSLSWIKDRVLPYSSLTKICNVSEHSLLVFEEEYYAHYVHGRKDECAEVRSMGPLSTCRVAFVPQIRVVYNQLSTPAGITLEESESRRVLLSKFLAAFFERALDGLNWVASERTILERLLDVELTSREAGTTSALLYDHDTTPSCMTMTWWDQEWNLSTFDAMLFSAAFVSSGDGLLAGLITYLIWKILKQVRTLFGNRNIINKTGIDVHY